MRKSIIVHLDSLEVLSELTNEQSGILFKAIKSYANGIEPELDFSMKLAFLPFKNQFIRDSEKYEKTCEVRRVAGSIGGKQKVANASKSKQKVANLADSDSNNKNDSNKDSDSKNEIYLWFEQFSKKENWFNLWNSWTEYKSSQFKFSYKSKKTEMAAIKELFTLSERNFENAEKIVNKSIANGYKGLFTINESNKPAEKNETQIKSILQQRKEDAAKLLNNE